MDKDGFNGQGWYFSDHNSAEGVGDAGVYTDEGEGGIEGVVFVELDLEILVDYINTGGVMRKLRRQILGQISQGSMRGLRLGDGRGSRWM